MSLGFAFGFGIAQIEEIDYRLIILLCVLVFSFILYALLEFFIGRFGARFCKPKDDTMMVKDEETMMDGEDGSVHSKKNMMETSGYSLYSDT